MKLNTNSNSYTMVYSIVLVVIVSFLLAFVYVALKPQQDKNVALDQKKQILNSLNLRGLSDAEAEATYNKVVREDSIGNKHYYNCLVKGQRVVVFPLKGMGLWGGISGFIAVNASDMNTVYGVYFNHESETAGLGAEIKDNGIELYSCTGEGPLSGKGYDDEPYVFREESVRGRIEDQVDRIDFLADYENATWGHSYY